MLQLFKRYPLLAFSFNPSIKVRSAANLQKFEQQKKARAQKKNAHLEYQEQRQDDARISHCYDIAKKGYPVELEALNPDRNRELSGGIEFPDENEEENVSLYKEWTRFRLQQVKQMHNSLFRLQQSRERAMQQLKIISPMLYRRTFYFKLGNSAIEIPSIPDYPPKEGYEAPEPLIEESKKKKRR